MSRWTAEMFFFVGRSVFRAEKVHGKNASHHFSPAGQLFEPKKFTERVLRTKSASHHFSPAGRLGAVDGAPSTCCAKHSSVNFFAFFERRIPCTKNIQEAFRSPPEASRSLPEPFWGFFERNLFFQFFIIFNGSSTSNSVCFLFGLIYVFRVKVNHCFGNWQMFLSLPLTINSDNLFMYVDVS